jgi:hypothetical protein
MSQKDNSEKREVYELKMLKKDACMWHRWDWNSYLKKYRIGTGH